jgi:hypothetical protein
MRLEQLRTRKVRRPRDRRPLVDALETRLLPAPVNVLVNNPGEDTTAQDTQSETSSVSFTNASGQKVIVVGFNDSGSLDPSFNPPFHFTGYARSTDGGATFTDLGVLPDTANGDAGDPTLVRDAVTGRIYFATLDFATGNTLPVFTSNDDGLTFQAPVNAAPGRDSLDKEWLAIDNNPGPGQGTVYCLFRDFGSGNGIFLTKSTDGGATWGPSGGVQVASGNAGNVQGANVVVGPDHSVYAFYFDQSAATPAIRVRRSIDGGNTFGPVHTVTTLTSSGPFNGDLGLSPGFRTSEFPQAAVNPVNGNLYVVYDNVGVAPGDKADVFLRVSTNRGQSWGAPIRVNDDRGTNDQWQPTLAVTPDGTRLGVFWYDRRNDPADNLIDRYGSVAALSGGTVTFGPNYRITDVSYPPAFGNDPVVNPVYMGDYDTTTADNNFFYNTWEDNRLPDAFNANQQDVRFAKIASHVAGPIVTAVYPTGVVAGPIGDIRVTFNEPIDPSTLLAGPNHFVLTGPNGPLALRDFEPIVPVRGTNNTQFIVWFQDPAAAAGTYTLTIGPDIADLSGNLMDTNLNGIGGEVPGDAVQSSFTILAPQIIASTPNGLTAAPVTDVQVTFSTPMDPNTFDTSDVTFTGPNGPITPTNVVPIDPNNTQFDISFPPQSSGGVYSMVIGPNIDDLSGNPMAQPYTATFSIFRQVNYQDVAVPLQFVELSGDPNAFSIIPAADDLSVPVDLGSHTFAFYNGVYTGNNQLFVSSNALISFGSANSEFFNQDLTTDPTQAAIAPLWDDLITGSGSPMVLGKFTTFNGSPALVIEWNQVSRYPGGTPNNMTFETILMLDTGSNLGDIYFEYPAIDTGDGNGNGASATTGIKDAGSQQPQPAGNQLLINFDNATNPLVQSGTAIHLFVNSGPSPVGGKSPGGGGAGGGGGFAGLANGGGSSGGGGLPGGGGGFARSFSGGGGGGSGGFSMGSRPFGKVGLAPSGGWSSPITRIDYGALVGSPKGGTGTPGSGGSSGGGGSAGGSGSTAMAPPAPSSNSSSNSSSSSNSFASSTSTPAPNAVATDAVIAGVVDPSGSLLTDALGFPTSTAAKRKSPSA